MILNDDYFHRLMMIFFLLPPSILLHLVVPHIFEHSFIFGDFMTFSRRSMPLLDGRAVDDMGFAVQ